MSTSSRGSTRSRITSPELDPSTGAEAYDGGEELGNDYVFFITGQDDERLLRVAREVGALDGVPGGEGANVKELHAQCDPEQHVIAHVFKVTVDPSVGKMGVFRIHQGTVTRDSQLYIGDGRKPFKVGHLFMLQGREHVEVARGV